MYPEIWVTKNLFHFCWCFCLWALIRLLNLFQLMGLWYGAEIITHHEDQAYETTYDSCVVVHLADVNEVRQKFMRTFNINHVRRLKFSYWSTIWRTLNWLTFSADGNPSNFTSRIEAGSVDLRSEHFFTSHRQQHNMLYIIVPIVAASTPQHRRFQFHSIINIFS